MTAFIVSTGRCGSTLLSRALAVHHDVLSLSEFFTSLQPAAFPNGKISGLEFWRLLSDQESGTANILFKAGIEPPEMLYPVDAARRFNRDTGVPRILSMTLPAITENPDMLYDRLAAAVPAFATGPIAEQYNHLFALLAAWHGRQVWVERSGASGFFIEELLSCFPEARYIHLARDLEATASSMSRHSFFRLAALRMEFVRRCRADVMAGEEPASPVPPDLVPLLPDQFAKAAFDRWSPDLSAFRLMAAYQEGLIRSTLRRVADDRVHRMRYEDLIRDPGAEFSSLAEFLELPDSARWARRAAGLVHH